jgi:hydroxymethylpyrimidine pyrophosphatase-like HAD family hydrolase
MGTKRLVIFDFDGTLADTGGDINKYKTIYREKTGLDWKGTWWDNPKSLDYDMFQFKRIEPTFDLYSKSINEPNTITVMLTGRKSKLSNEVEKVLKKLGINKFNHYLYNYGGNTLLNKKEQILRLIDKYPEVEELVMYDDRENHLKPFNEFGERLISKDSNKIKKFYLYQVKDGKIIRTTNT